AVSRSAYEHQKKINNGEVLVVGVNCFTGDNELEVETTRLVPHPYDPVKRERAEGKQRASLKKVKKNRDNEKVKKLLKQLDKKTRNTEENLVKHLIKCAKAYVSIQEVADVFRDVFGEYEAPSIL
ncbi:MAG: methylmalonyl-CoA mutase family protein, partial [Candidatus Adiutricales bacterium]